MDSFHKYNKILLPTDGSKCSKKAAKHALWIANATDAQIIILHVVDTHIIQLGYSGFFKEDLFDMLMDDGKRIMDGFIQEIEEYEVKCSKDIIILSKLKDGEPYDEIVKTTNDEGVDLIVMGASGRHGIDKILLGSVTERVVRKSGVPILVVH